MLRPHKMTRPAVVVAACLSLLAALGACSIANYGKLEPDPEVARDFKAYRALPAHSYYYRGTESRPTVIAGINKNYVLSSQVWVAVEPESEKFRKLIDRVSLQGVSGRTSAWGFTILDKNGNEVGVWYSASRAATVEIDDTGRVVNLSPQPAAAIGDQY